MTWQLYWPAWWHLLPRYTRVLDDDLPLYHCGFCWGPFQARWYEALDHG